MPISKAIKGLITQKLDLDFIEKCMFSVLKLSVYIRTTYVREGHIFKNKQLFQLSILRLKWDNLVLDTLAR